MRRTASIQAKHSLSSLCELLLPSSELVLTQYNIFSLRNVAEIS